MNKLPVGLMLCLALALLAGCRSVPMVSKMEDVSSKQFKLPPRDAAGIYIYRSSGWSGKTQVKAVWLDGQLLGYLAASTYFTLEVTPGAHTLSTQATPDQNDVHFTATGGRNYYFSQVLSKKVPVVGAVISPFVSVATFEQVGEQEGQENVLQCQQAAMEGLAPAGAPAQPLTIAQPDCVAALDGDPELQAIGGKVALSGKDDKLEELRALKERPTPAERKVIVKWAGKRQACFNGNPPPRDSYYQLSVDAFNQGQKLIQELAKGAMSYGQFAERRNEIKQSSIAKAQALKAK